MLFSCLKKTNTSAAQVMGSIYFNLVQVRTHNRNSLRPSPTPSFLVQSLYSSHHGTLIQNVFFQVPCLQETPRGLQFRKAREGF